MARLRPAVDVQVGRRLRGTSRHISAGAAAISTGGASSFDNVSGVDVRTFSGSLSDESHRGGTRSSGSYLAGGQVWLQAQQ